MTSSGSPTRHTPPAQPLLGVSLALMGGVLMGGIGIVGKFGAGAGVSPFQLLAAQVALLVPVAGLWLYRVHGWRGFVVRRPWILVVRTVSGFVYFWGFYWALQGLSIADALVLESTNPFFAMLIASVFLRHRPSKAAMAMTVVAFAGVCLILIHHGAKNLVNPYSLLALLAGVGRASGSATTGLAGRTEPPARIIFYYASGMFLLAAATLPWEWRQIEAQDWWILAAPGLIFVPQNLAYTVANRLSPAYLVGALFYIAILVGVVADRVLWDVRIDGRGIAGMTLVVAAGLGLAWIRAREASESGEAKVK